MDLTHSFTVPTDLEATWTHFGDIAGLAACFPGAQVTSVSEDADGAATFEGTCKVKLGPIALVYAGSGRFVERDAAAHRFVVEAKGRDKRGNGTAGATVTVQMESGADTSGAAGGTRLEVVTDLAITGKPAQFGRGVMQDVSDKLLAQFVSCLEQRLRAGDDEAGATAPVPGAGDPAPAAAPASSTTPASQSAAAAAGASATATAAPPVQPVGAVRPAPASNDDALDLGSAVLPVLMRTYAPKIAVGLVAVLVLSRLLRRRR
ncbi:SRPBCC family protein [Nocardioides sp.]|uniref:SRPBCC family protein n=1 Tax=Nocardioides sp. TaxID=35761 RepID=UPI00351929AE